MRKAALLVSAAAVALAGGLAFAGDRHIAPTSAGSSAKARPFISGAPPGLVTLYDQNGDDASDSIDSQNFESSFDAYDDQAADDFVVPSPHVWAVKEVDVTGVYFVGSGPANSVNLFFYKDSGGLPGALLHTCTVVPTDNFGSFVIKLPRICHAKFKAGHYWISVQVNMDFSTGGEWGWERNSIVHDNPAAWQNPGDGFGTGCKTYHYESQCGFAPGGADGDDDH